MRSLLAGLLALILAAPPTLAADLKGPARVIDGDTIEVAGQRVRLHGIDAPEADQTCRLGSQEWQCGLVATARLIEATQGQDVRCEERDRDRYQRIVAVCFVGDTDLNAWLASEGWALAYREYSPHSIACACMAFIIRNAPGKLLIVAARGIGGAPSRGSRQPTRSTPSYPPDTDLRTSPETFAH